MSIRKPPKSVPPVDFLPWTAAWFQSPEARDGFLRAASSRTKDEVEVEPMPGQTRCVRLRWRPGQFLGLNDLAHAHGGRIVFGTRRPPGRIS